MSELVRLRIRVFVDGEIHSDERFEHSVEEFQHLLPRLAALHADLCQEQPTMIEIEFLDEPDEQVRFFRIGTDPRRMVKPVGFGPKYAQNGAAKGKGQ